MSGSDRRQSRRGSIARQSLVHGPKVDSSQAAGSSPLALATSVVTSTAANASA